MSRQLLQTRRLAAGVVLAIALTALSPVSEVGAKPKFRKSASFGPIPVKGDCLGNTSPGGCIWNARETEFALSSHIVHVGGRISGTGTSVFKQVPITTGAGLKLKRKRVTPGKGFTATWDAVSDTGTVWQYGVGIEISLLGGIHPDYLESDYYAVVDKRAAILEGHVRDTAKLPVPAMEILIDGLGSVADENFAATTAYDGYYAVRLKPGRYRVCMRDVKDDGSIGREQCATSKVVAPVKRAVTVRAKKTATADFEVQGSPRTEVKLAEKSVPATGLAGTKLTVRTINRWGKPDPGQELLISPNVRGSAAADLAVPALVCDATGGRWPAADPTSISAREPFKARTDTAGTYEATIAAGTIGGPWTISARNLTTDSPRGYATTMLTVTPEVGQSLPALRAAVDAGLVGGSVPSLESYGADPNDQTVLQWLLALRTLPVWHGVDIIPIAGFAANQRAVLLAPAGAVTIDPAGNLTGDLSQGRVLETPGGGAETGKQEVAMGGPVGQLPVNWAATDWVAGTSPGLAPAARGAARVNGYVFSGRRYGGFPYPTGVAKACT